MTISQKNKQKVERYQRKIKAAQRKIEGYQRKIEKNRTGWLGNSHVVEPYDTGAPPPAGYEYIDATGPTDGNLNTCPFDHSGKMQVVKDISSGYKYCKGYETGHICANAKAASGTGWGGVDSDLPEGMKPCAQSAVNCGKSLKIGVHGGSATVANKERPSCFQTKEGVIGTCWGKCKSKCFLPPDSRTDKVTGKLVAWTDESGNGCHITADTAGNADGRVADKKWCETMGGTFCGW